MNDRMLHMVNYIMLKNINGYNLVLGLFTQCESIYCSKTFSGGYYA